MRWTKRHKSNTLKSQGETHEASSLHSWSLCALLPAQELFRQHYQARWTLLPNQAWVWAEQDRADGQTTQHTQQHPCVICQVDIFGKGSGVDVLLCLVRRGLCRAALLTTWCTPFCQQLLLGADCGFSHHDVLLLTAGWTNCWRSCFEITSHGWSFSSNSFFEVSEGKMLKSSIHSFIHSFSLFINAQRSVRLQGCGS